MAPYDTRRLLLAWTRAAPSTGPDRLSPGNLPAALPQTPPPPAAPPLGGSHHPIAAPLS